MENKFVAEYKTLVSGGKELNDSFAIVARTIAYLGSIDDLKELGLIDMQYQHDELEKLLEKLEAFK